MATVGTTTTANSLAGPGTPSIARRMDAAPTYLYTVVQSNSTTVTVFRSIDSGTSWSTYMSFTKTGLQEISNVVIDASRFLHIAYRVSTGTADTIWYRRAGLSSNTWSPEIQVSGSPANGGVAGSRFQAVGIAVVRNSNGTYAIIVGASYQDAAGGNHGIYLHGVSIKNDTATTIYSNNGIITGTRSWFSTGIVGRQGFSIELEHNGDGFTSSTPNAWVVWGRSEIRMVKVAWVSSTVGWQGPSSPVVVRSTLATAQNNMAGRWDGTQWLIPVQNPDDTDTVRVYQRNKANTTTTTYDSPTHPQGVITVCAITYDNTTKNFRIFAVGTSAATIYYVDYTRATGVWGTWTLLSATVPVANEWNLRAGGNTMNAKYDIVLQSGTVSPWTITHIAQSTSTPPSIATFITAGAAYANGGAANVSAALPLSWTFSDVDPGQTQGSYALSRQIGAGAVAYYNATTLTWGASEVQNTSSTAGVTLASAWGVDADPNYTYKVKVWDSAGTASSGYSQALVLTPSTPVNPTVTAPTASQVFTADTLTASWTVAEQTGARVILATNPGGTVVYDSGSMIGYTDTSFEIPYQLPNNSGWTVSVITYNNEKLASVTQNVNFTVAYAPPPAVGSTLVASSTAGTITVTPVVLAAVGTQPVILQADLYRRKRSTTANLLTNGDFNGNTTGWTNSGGTLTYSTTQKHGGAGAARFVPNASADALVVTATASGPNIASTALVGGDITVAGWLRPDTANKAIKVAVNFYDAANTLLGTQFTTIANVVALAWHYVEFTADTSTIVGTIAKATMSIGLTGTPASGDAFYVDDLEMRVGNAETGVRVAAGLAPATPYADWGPASGTDYEYRWITRGDNGTIGTGPWMG